MQRGGAAQLGLALVGAARRVLGVAVRGDFVALRAWRASVLSENSLDAAASTRGADSFARAAVVRVGFGPAFAVLALLTAGFFRAAAVAEVFGRYLLLGLTPVILMAPLGSSFPLPDRLSAVSDAFLPITGLVQQRVRAFTETVGQLRHVVVSLQRASAPSAFGASIMSWARTSGKELQRPAKQPPIDRLRSRPAAEEPAVRVAESSTTSVATAPR